MHAVLWSTGSKTNSTQNKLTRADDINIIYFGANICYELESLAAHLLHIPVTILIITLCIFAITQWQLAEYMSPLSAMFFFFHILKVFCLQIFNCCSSYKFPVSSSIFLPLIGKRLCDKKVISVIFHSTLYDITSFLSVRVSPFRRKVKAIYKEEQTRAVTPTTRFPSLYQSHSFNKSRPIMVQF